MLGADNSNIGGTYFVGDVQIGAVDDRSDISEYSAGYRIIFPCPIISYLSIRHFPVFPVDGGTQCAPGRAGDAVLFLAGKVDILKCI